MRINELIILGHLPWNSLEAKASSEESCPVDGETEYKKCFSCPYPECINCLCKDETTKRIDEFEEMLFRKRMTRKQICETMNIPTSTFYNYKTACGDFTPKNTRRITYENN